MKDPYQKTAVTRPSTEGRPEHQPMPDRPAQAEARAAALAKAVAARESIRAAHDRMAAAWSSACGAVVAAKYATTAICEAEMVRTRELLTQAYHELGVSLYGVGKSISEPCGIVTTMTERAGAPKPTPQPPDNEWRNRDG